MQRKTWLTLLIVAFLVGGTTTACKKKQPVVPAVDDTAVEEPVTEIDEPDDVEYVDETPNPLAGDLI